MNIGPRRDIAWDGGESPGGSQRTQGPPSALPLTRRGALASLSYTGPQFPPESQRGLDCLSASRCGGGGTAPFALSLEAAWFYASFCQHLSKVSSKRDQREGWIHEQRVFITKERDECTRCWELAILLLEENKHQAGVRLGTSLPSKSRLKSPGKWDS